jgi:hypothetical protein
MGKLSKEERAELEARLAADDADDDDDDEVEFRHSDGTSLRGSFRRVAAYAESRGVKLKSDPKPAEGDSTGDGGTVKRFTSGRRTG